MPQSPQINLNTLFPAAQEVPSMHDHINSPHSFWQLKHIRNLAFFEHAAYNTEFLAHTTALGKKTPNTRVLFLFWEKR